MMKKLWLTALALSLAIFATGCSEDKESANPSSDENKQAESTEKASSEDTKGELKTALLDFQLNIVDLLKKNYGPINDYTAAIGEESTATPEEVESARVEAEKASKTLAEEVRKVEIPEAVGDKKESLSSALETLGQSFDKRAEMLAGKNDAGLAEADKLFEEFESAVSGIYKEVGLLAPSFKAELQ